MRTVVKTVSLTFLYQSIDLPAKAVLDVPRMLRYILILGSFPFRQLLDNNRQATFEEKKPKLSAQRDKSDMLVVEAFLLSLSKYPFQWTPVGLVPSPTSIRGSLLQTVPRTMLHLPHKSLSIVM